MQDNKEYICPNCKQAIYDEEALLCHFCGESLQRAGDGFLSNLRYSDPKIMWISLAVIIAVIFIISMVF